MLQAARVQSHASQVEIEMVLRSPRAAITLGRRVPNVTDGNAKGPRDSIASGPFGSFRDVCVEEGERVSPIALYRFVLREGREEIGL